MASLVKQFTNDIADKTGISDIRAAYHNGGLGSAVDATTSALYKASKGPRFTGSQPNPLVDVNDKFSKSNAVYSGTDCLIAIQINQNVIILGNVSTFSYSIFREKGPVRTLGRTNPKGYASGGRSIAGSIIFTVFNEHPLYELIKHVSWKNSPNERYSSPMADSLPPVDVMLIYSNEYGASSVMKIYAMEMFQEGQVTSINDIYTENTMQFVARDIDMMVSNNEINEFKRYIYEKQLEGKFVDGELSGLLEYKAKLEREISTLDKEIAEYNKELNKRFGLSVLTVTGSYWYSQAKAKSTGDKSWDSGFIEEQMNAKIKKKNNKIEELKEVNIQIKQHEFTFGHEGRSVTNTHETDYKSSLVTPRNPN